MTKEIGCAECGVSGGHALYCLSCTEKFFIKGKEWVRLTNEQIEEIWGNTPMMLNSHKVFAKAIEAKLKEKNT